MDHPFGWDLPPGVRLSDPGGPHDPERMRWEAAIEHIEDALYQASRAGLTVAEINQAWAEATEEAYYDELKEYDNIQDYPDEQDLRGE